MPPSPGRTSTVSPGPATGQATTRPAAGAADASITTGKRSGTGSLGEWPLGSAAPTARNNNSHRGVPLAPGPTDPAISTGDAVRVPEPLWREVVGEQIRRIRTDRAERLADVARRAGMSPQYLSEIERGVKDPSSELLAAVAGALGTSVEGLAQRAYRIASISSLGDAPSRQRMAPGPACMAA